MKNYLNFESEIKNIEAEIDKLKDPYDNEAFQQLILAKLINYN